MSVFLWSLVGSAVGLAVGAAVGFAAALALASMLPNPNDGTFAMRQMMFCLPLGALAGLGAGVAWGVSR